MENKINLLVKSYFKKGDIKADLLIDELLMLFNKESKLLEKPVMQKIVDVIDKELPRLLLNFYDRRTLDGRLIGRYFNPNDQVKLSLEEFKKQLSNFR